MCGMLKVFTFRLGRSKQQSVVEVVQARPGSEKGGVNSFASDATTIVAEADDSEKVDRVIPVRLKGGFGLETLYQPAPGEEIIADVVFVHGLTGGRRSTWTMPSEKDPWPKKFLPGAMPGARISTFGYDAEVVNMWEMSSQSGVRDHARKLILQLTVLRKDISNNSAPIILIAHSLGGLVCEEAIILLSQSTEQSQRRIWCGNIGLMLIGTPHGGSALAKWAERSTKVLPRSVNKKLLQLLRTDSELLNRLQEDFQAAMNLRTKRDRLPQIQIACFFEELSVRGLKQMVVEKQSAQLSSAYPAIGIRSNHIDLGRFESDQNESYLTIVHLLKDWIRTAPEQATDVEAHELAIRPVARVETSHMYSNIVTKDNALQLNGDVGTMTQNTTRINSYQNVAAAGNSKQINGNMSDPAAFKAFFSS